MSKDYFYPNICHVCKENSSVVTLTKCRKCSMISYCSEQHQLYDKQNHEALCSAIEYYSIVNNKKGIPTTVQVPNQSQWMHFKYQFMTDIQKILKRPLLRFEKQMFMFPRSCVICHKQEDLEYCICPSTNFCSEHLENNRHRNENVCEHMRMSFALDDPNNWNKRNLNMHYLQLLPYGDIIFRENEHLIVNIFENYIKPLGLYLGNISSMADVLIHINYHAQQIEAPLTLYYTMCRVTYTNFENTLLIYVITNEFLGAASLHGWEILMHFIPWLTNLRIVSVGPKLQFQPLRAYDDLCGKCILHRKKLSYSSFQYPLVITKLEPCLIISFNARIYEDKATHIDLKTYDICTSDINWKYTLRCLADLKVGPVILTCNNEDEAIENTLAIKNILNMEQHVDAFPNAIPGIRPYRNPETETALFQNQYILVYNSLVRNAADLNK